MPHGQLSQRFTGTHDDLGLKCVGSKRRKAPWRGGGGTVRGKGSGVEQGEGGWGLGVDPRFGSGFLYVYVVHGGVGWECFGSALLRTGEKCGGRGAAHVLVSKEMGRIKRH